MSGGKGVLQGVGSEAALAARHIQDPARISVSMVHGLPAAAVA